MQRFLLSPLPWLTVYVSLLAGIAIGVMKYRDAVLSDQPEQQAAWQEWREAAAKQDGRTGPVAREVPPSEEPPMVVLMRDHFGVMLGAGLIFPGLILGFLMIIAHGVVAQSLGANQRGGPAPADASRTSSA